MSKKINKKDSNNLLILGVLCVLVLLIIMFTYVTRLIPFRYAVYAIAAVEVLLLMPAICRKYYAVKTGESPWYCYVPGLNILQLCLNKAYIAMFVISVLLTGIFACCVFLPYDFKAEIFGDTLAYNLAYRSVGYLVFTVILFSIVLGLIYVSIQRDVLGMICYVSNTSTPVSEYMLMVLAFIPLLRCMFLASLNQHLTKLQMNGYKDYEVQDDYDISEEELE